MDVATMKLPAVIALIGVAMGSTGALWSLQRSPTLSPDTATKLTEISLQLDGPFDPKYAGEMVASRSALFQHEGLHVELREGDLGADPIILASNGSNTFGVARGDIFLIARSKGAPIVAFAAGYLESPVAFYALEKSGIHTPQDFIGKRIVRQAGKETATIYDALLAKLQISRGQVREFSNKTNFAAFLNGEVDVWPGHVGMESYLLQQKGIAYNIIYPSDYGVHVPGTVYFASEKIIRDQPSLVQKVLDAVIAGWSLTYADYSKSVPMISTFDEKALTPDRVLFELKAQRNIILPLGRRFTEYDDGQWKSLRNILIAERLIHDSDSIDLSKAINYDFLREAYRKPISFGN